MLSLEDQYKKENKRWKKLGYSFEKKRKKKGYSKKKYLKILNQQINLLKS